MMSTLVDANVLIDVLQPGSPWFEWSREQLAGRRVHGATVINQIIVAEVAAGYRDLTIARAALSAPIWKHEELPWAAAFIAGAVHREYRRRGGDRERTLPDFLIGAHAAVSGHILLTRDARRYRTYFPDIEIIAPDIEE
ncbi:MAG: type II toxin-antitoxin system VapC family toxin [Hyphomicrobiales bacterium]